MTEKKIIIDNSVKYVTKDSNSQSEQTRQSKPNTREKTSIAKKNKAEGFSQNSKKFCKNLAAE